MGIRKRPQKTGQTDHGSKYRSVNRLASKSGPQNDPHFLRDPLTILKMSVTKKKDQARYMSTTYSYIMNSTYNNEGETTVVTTDHCYNNPGTHHQDVSTQMHLALQ